MPGSPASSTFFAGKYECMPTGTQAGNGVSRICWVQRYASIVCVCAFTIFYRYISIFSIYFMHALTITHHHSPIYSRKLLLNYCKYVMRLSPSAVAVSCPQCLQCRGTSWNLLSISASSAVALDFRTFSFSFLGASNINRYRTWSGE